MKILWLSPTTFHPQDAGNRAHVYNMGRTLKDAGHDFQFVLYNQEGVTDTEIEEMRRIYPKLIVIPHVRKIRKKSLGEVWGIDDWYNEDIENAIKLLLTQDYDAILCEYVFFSKALTLAPPHMLKILDCHDRMSNRHLMLNAHGIPLNFFYTTPEQEKIGLDRADVILAIQNEERAYFQSLTAKPVLEIGYLADYATLPLKESSGKLRVGIMASSNLINQKSVADLFDAINKKPEIRNCIEVVLAGKIANFFRNECDVNLGVVDKEKEFYDQVDLVVNPMVDGTGLKIKTVSAILHHKPIISTMAGSAGLKVNHPAHKCSNPEEIAQWLGNIVFSQNRQDELADLYRESVQLADSYKEHRDKLINYFLSLIGHKHKKVLLVTEIPFWEEGIGSHERIKNLCKFLNYNFNLQIFFFGSIYKERNVKIAEAGLDGKVISYKDYEEQARNISINLDSSIPALDSKRCDHFGKCLHIFLKNNHKYDVIIFEYIWNAYLRKAVPYTCLKILDLHDFMFFRKYMFGNEYKCLNIKKSEELKIYNRFDSILCIQKEEYNYIKKAHLQALPIYCGHHAAYAKISMPFRTIDFGYIGNNSDINFDAITWFIHNVWSIQPHTRATLHIFGSVCDLFKSVPPNVKLHGLKKDIENIYSLCQIMVNPIFFGSGLKIKSVEALAHGKVLLSSPEGARGIDDPERSGVVVAKNRQEFINGMLCLTYDDVYRKNMADAAGKAARTQFSEENVYGQLLNIIECY